MSKVRSLSALLKKYKSSKITKEELRRLLEGEPFGRVTGIIGPYVLRYNKDKLIISDRAIEYNASQSARSVLNRENFAAEVKFASHLNKIPLLKKVWQAADIAGFKAYNKIISQNKINGRRPASNNIITPRKYHFFNKTTCAINKDLTISIHAGSNLRYDENIIIVIIPYDPIDRTDNSFEIISVQCDSPLPGSEILLDESQRMLCTRYKKYILYSSIIRQNGNGIEWTNTLAIEGKFNIESRKIKVELLLFLFLIRICQINKSLRPWITNTRGAIHIRDQ